MGGDLSGGASGELWSMSMICNLLMVKSGQIIVYSGMVAKQWLNAQKSGKMKFRILAKKWPNHSYLVAKQQRNHGENIR